MKKILFLGASGYFYDAALYAKSIGLYLIAIDIQPAEKAIVKTIADESYMMSTTDFDSVYKLCKEKEIDGIYAGASEVNIPIAIKLTEKLNLPYFATLEQWKMCTNKDIFKEKCQKHGIRVAKTFDINDNITFPVVVKPTDSNGSQGVSICRNRDELEISYDKAISFSNKGKVLIEEYIPSDSVIIHITIIDGEVFYSGMSDKKSKKIIDNGPPIMALQLFPSTHEQEYLDKVHDKVVSLINDEKILNGPIWIESFYHEQDFIFNEVGFRYGGSLTYYPVEFYYDINQMHLLINQSIGNPLNEFKTKYNSAKNRQFIYAILPIQINPGTIKEIIGLDKGLEVEGIYKFVQSLPIGTTVYQSGTTSQVFGYLHIIGLNQQEIEKSITNFLNIVKVVSDNNDKNQIFTIWKEYNHGE